MEEKLKEAIQILADKIDASVTSDDALKYMQAALNAANAFFVLTTKQR